MWPFLYLDETPSKKVRYSLAVEDTNPTMPNLISSNIELCSKSAFTAIALPRPSYIDVSRITLPPLCADESFTTSAGMDFPSLLSFSSLPQRNFPSNNTSDGLCLYIFNR